MIAGCRERERTKKRTATPRGSADETSASPDAPHVLVVDDHEDNRALYVEYLEYHGYRVTGASDGADALAKIAKDPPQVVVMDLAMPLVDGWETTARLKSRPQTKDIFVIVLTGHAVREATERARRVGADKVFTKPCLPHDLLAGIRTLLSAEPASR